TDHKHVAVKHLLRDAPPVIPLDHAPLLLFAFQAAQAGKNLFSRKGDKLRFDPRLLTLPEDHLDELCGIPLFAHAARQPENFHRLPFPFGIMIVLIPGVSPRPVKAATISSSGSLRRYSRWDGQLQSLHPKCSMPSPSRARVAASWHSSRFVVGALTAYATTNRGSVSR